jgi:putative ABC transport system permease protein
MVWMFGVIGLFVLLLACINFMNLSTARSEKRAKEVSIRKTLGSMRSQLIKLFLGESLLAVVVSFVVGACVVWLSLSWFNQVADKKISFPFFNPVFWIISLLFIVITALLAGSYPALYLSAFQPVKVLKGTFRKGSGGARLRQGMVILQFTFSIMLIIGTIVVYRQIQYAQNLPVGYNKNGLIQVVMNTPDLNGKYEVLRQQLLSSGGATGFAQSSSDATKNNYFDGNFDWEGRDKSATQFSFALTAVTADFGKTVGWQFIAGRDFSRSFTTDQSGVILNETAAKNIGFKDPIGKTIKWTGHNTFTIVGVIKDMVIESPYKGVQQTLYFYAPTIGPIITIRLNPVLSPAQALSKIEPIFRGLNPSGPFEYQFVDEEYGQKFAAEQRVGKLSSVFAAFAIFISCLGIFGLSSYVAEQRRKEIGVRKVLGASVAAVWTLLSKEFVILVLIAIGIATPLAWYFMYKWLQGYEYHATMAWWIFVVAGLGAMGITVLTVSYQTISAALTKPVKSLRSE